MNLSEMDNEEKLAKANEIVQGVVKGLKTAEELKFFSNKELLADLMITLDSHSERSILFNSANMAIAEHVFLLSMVMRNLNEATKLLKANGIEFNSMLDD